MSEFKVRIHKQNMTNAAKALADKKTFGHLSYWVALKKGEFDGAEVKPSTQKRFKSYDRTGQGFETAVATDRQADWLSTKNNQIFPIVSYQRSPMV